MTQRLRHLRIVFLSLYIQAPAGAYITTTDAWTPQAPAVQVSPNALQSVRAFPNPWRSDRHAGHFVTFDHLAGNATVKIFSVAAQHVKTLSASGADSIEWDLTNDSGATVASGLYLYLISTDGGERSAGKLAVIR